MSTDVSQVIYAVGRLGPSGLTLTGTCFAVGPRRIATAYHVVGSDDRNLAMVLPRVGSLAEYQDTADLAINTIPLTMAAVDPIRDLCILELPADTSVPYIEALGSTDTAAPGAAILTFGFPHANFGRMVLTQHDTHVGARVLIESQGQKSKHLVLNTQAREGQSGGPVFLADRVIAVLLGSYAPGGGGGISLGGVDPATLHQTTHAISAEYLGAML